MGLFSRMAVVGLSILCVAAPAWAAGPAASEIEAGLNWHLAFGGTTLEAGYSLSLGYRSGDLSAPRARLLALDLDSRRTAATLAGLPLFARSYQANQAGDAPVEAESGVRPWYTRSWVLWTVGGLATTAALAGSTGGSSTTEENDNGASAGPRACALSGGNVGPQEIPDACVTPTGVGTGFAGRAPILDERVSDVRWLDEGTGGMGDLEATR